MGLRWHVFLILGWRRSLCVSKPYHEETERYVLVTTNINLPLAGSAAGFQDRARALGVKLK